MMRLKDFRIEITERGKKLSDLKSEDLDETLLRINNWVETNEHVVLNIETLFFTGLNHPSKKTGDAVFAEHAHATSSYHYQIFRVWYKESTPVSAKHVEELI